MNFFLSIIITIAILGIGEMVMSETIIIYRAEASEIVLIDDILEDLAMCESSNNPQAFNRYDPVTSSYGLYQFKLETFNYFGKRYGLEHSDVMNPEQQKAIARMMLSEGRYSHWYNCLKEYEGLNVYKTRPPTEREIKYMEELSKQVRE